MMAINVNHGSNSQKTAKRLLCGDDCKMTKRLGESIRYLLHMITMQPAKRMPAATQA